MTASGGRPSNGEGSTLYVCPVLRNHWYGAYAGCVLATPREFSQDGKSVCLKALLSFHELRDPVIFGP